MDSWAGHTGLHPSGNCSTRSSARFPIPNDDEDLLPIREKAFAAWSERPVMPGGGMQSPITCGKTKRDLTLTCGNCRRVCHPDPEERKRRLERLQQGGVIIQHEDGSLQTVSLEEAKKHVAAREPERRVL